MVIRFFNNREDDCIKSHSEALKLQFIILNEKIRLHFVILSFFIKY